jgi:hypothetical protein
MVKRKMTIVEYATTISAVDCVKFAGIHVLSGALHILKNKKNRHSPYDVSLLFYEA